MEGWEQSVLPISGSTGSPSVLASCMCAPTHARYLSSGVCVGELVATQPLRNLMLLFLCVRIPTFNWLFPPIGLVWTLDVTYLQSLRLTLMSILSYQARSRVADAITTQVLKSLKIKYSEFSPATDFQHYSKTVIQSSFSAWITMEVLKGA